MRIVHIITRLIIGGAQENTLLTCAGLAERGHDVVLMSGPQTGPEGSLWEDAVALGVRTIALPLMVRQIALATDWRCAHRLATLLAELRPDVVHTHSSKAGIIGRWAANRAGVPRIIHTIHGMSFNRTQPAPVRVAYRFLERRAAAWTDGFISVADAMTDQAVAAGIAPRERFTTVYSGMRVDRFAPDAAARAHVRAEWRLGADALVVGTVARLFRNKGYEHILAAMPHIASACPPARFVWVGDGKDRDRYVKRLAELGLTDRVTLVGLVAPARIPEILNGFDLLLHASMWEGLPRVAAQALLTQVPAVSFDLDGAREVVEHAVTGLLAPAGDSPSLAEATIGLLRDPQRRASMGCAGRQRCLSRFDYRRMVADIERVYRTVAPARTAWS